MRVVLVSQEMPPETAWGGIGTYADVLSSALVELGHDVHVVSVAPRQPRTTIKREGVTIHRFNLPRLPGPGRLAPEAWRRTWLSTAVAACLNRVDVEPDIVECPEWNAEGLAIGIRNRSPLVVRLHSSAAQLFPFTGQGTRLHGWDGRAAARLENISARRANVVTSTGSNLAEVAAGLELDPSAMHAIPYPVRLPAPIPMSVTTPPQITFMGRLEPRKGPEVVLRAAPAVLAACPDARFVFAGRDGVAHGAPSSTAWLREEAQRLNVTHAIELPGQLSREELASVLARTTVCAFPSRWESFGNVAAEASAAGRPVVASAIPPFCELVEDQVTGHIVEGDDPRRWAIALLEVICDRERARTMGKAGTSRIANISAPARVAGLTVSAYEHAAERWQRGQRAGFGRRIA